MSSEFVVYIGTYITVGPLKKGVVLPISTEVYGGTERVCPDGHGDMGNGKFCSECGKAVVVRPRMTDIGFSISNWWYGLVDQIDELVRLNESAMLMDETDDESGVARLLLTGDRLFEMGVREHEEDTHTGSLVKRGNLLMGSEAVMWAEQVYADELAYLRMYFEYATVDFGWMACHE